MCKPLLAIDPRVCCQRPVKLCYDVQLPMLISLSIYAGQHWVPWMIDRSVFANAQLGHVTNCDLSAQRMGATFVLDLHPPGQRPMQLLLDNEDVYDYLMWTYSLVPPCRDPRTCSSPHCVECVELRTEVDLDCDLLTLTLGDPDGPH